MKTTADTEADALEPESPTPTRRPFGFGSVPSTRQVLAIVIIVFLVWEIVVPLIALLWASLKEARPSDPGFFTWELTLNNFRDAFGSTTLWNIMGTTAVFAVASSVFALMLGTAAAFITTRTNIILRGLIASIVLFQLAMPEVMFPIVWQFLLDPDIGLLNQWWTTATGFEGPLFNVYSMPGMIWVESFLLLPLVYIFMVPAISAMDRSLEEAVEVSGGARRHVINDVVLRLSAPAMVATLMISLMRAWEAFEVPWYLGLPGEIRTFSTFLYFRTITPPSDTGLISSFAMPMLLIALLLVWWYDRFNRAASRYSVITGRGYTPRIIEMQRAGRWLTGTVAMLVLAIGVLLPAFMLIWLSLNRFYVPPSLTALSSLSLDSFGQVLDRPAILTGFKNSLIIGLGSTLLILLVTSISTWFVAHGKNIRGRGVMNMLTFVPMAFPNIVVGICLLWLYLALPINLSGTYIVLILGYFILFVAIAARNIGARALQVNVELHEAATVSGASFLTSFRTVIIPALGPALLASAVYVTAWAFKELETTLLLSSPSTGTASVVMFDLSRVSTVSVTAAVGVVTGLALIVVVRLFQVFARRAGMTGF